MTILGRDSLNNRKFVSLAEALTWIAFGDAMAADDLKTHVEGYPPPMTDTHEERLRKFFAGQDHYVANVAGSRHFVNRQVGLDKIIEAWHQLREEVEHGTIRMRGRLTETYSLADARLASVEDLSGNLLAEFPQFDISTGGIRREPGLSPYVLWSGDPQSFRREFEAFGGNPRALGGYLMVEVERDGVIRRWPHPVKAPRKSHDEVVAWCEHWIAAGKGNGHDKAWNAFKTLPEHHGLSRDDVFRPAWKDAKLKRTGHRLQAKLQAT
ncbi:hypothetical protein [Sphingobium xenophagum]|uniref:hypothetical protein n=1 Tax=Sphingobium xenophagum TaxID=121428 RepID=UPI00037E5C66|nr:hypothetical protein [Sphingobium xenophagum]